VSEDLSSRGSHATPREGRQEPATDCREVLQEVYLYLDFECTEQRRQLIRAHLNECSPCLREYGIEQEVKALVNRCCGSETAPSELRARLRDKLTELKLRTGLRERLPE
jgi:mycothiol system anti-sigma-R factor